MTQHTFDLGARPRHIVDSPAWELTDERLDTLANAVSDLIAGRPANKPEPEPEVVSSDIPQLSPADVHVPLPKPGKTKFATSQGLNTRLTADLQRVLMSEQGLARDIAFFGQTRLDDIIDAYGMDHEDLATLMQEQRFQEMVQQYKVDVEKDVRGTLRARANMLLDAELELMHEIVCSPGAKDIDKIRATQLIAQLADALPSTGGRSGDFGGTGLNVTFNFGAAHPQAVGLRSVLVGEAARNGND